MSNMTFAARALLTGFTMFALLPAQVWADSAAERLADSAAVLREVMAMPARCARACCRELPCSSPGGTEDLSCSPWTSRQDMWSLP